MSDIFIDIETAVKHWEDLFFLLSFLTGDAENTANTEAAQLLQADNMAPKKHLYHINDINVSFTNNCIIYMIRVLACW